MEKKILLYENDINVYSSKNSLQENFKKFLNQRKNLRINNIKESKITNLNSSKMDEIRDKFVNQALKYLGTPYSKKFLNEDNPLYNSSIFLDCCGLIRQCVNDLKDDFGFMLYRWNQSYQFDTLPIKLKFEDMKKGDLIFYSSTFYPDKKWKVQKHNLVHVEIYLGLEEKSIAARDRYGVVEIFDTYKFESENYYDIQYHYRSIDTWLMGIHQSYCEEHKWNDDFINYDLNKYSIFKDEKEEEAEEEL